jgi:hypothetical protein
LIRPFGTALIVAAGAHASVAMAFVRPPPAAATPMVIDAGPPHDEQQLFLVEPSAVPDVEEQRGTEGASAFDAPKLVRTWKNAVFAAPPPHPTIAAAAAPAGDVTTPSGLVASTVSTVNLVRQAAPASVLDLPAARDLGPMAATVASGAGQGRNEGSTALDAVRAALDDHDRALGLGTDSALIAAIRNAALDSRVPSKSSAVLWATAAADGSVVDAEVTNTSRDAEAWNEVAAAVVSAMKGTRVRAVLGARGARLSFKVESLVRQGAGNAVAPSVRVGTPLYRCMEACTASGNIDPTDALLSATSRSQRVVDVRALASVRLD